MAELNPALFLAQEAANHTAIGHRMLIRSLSGILEGVCGENDMSVTASSTVLAVNVSDGSGFVSSDYNGVMGTYHIVSSGGASVTLDAAAHAGNFSRNDLIIARVYDEDAGDASSQWVLDSVTGTPTSGTPSDPAVPDTAIVLARCVVVGGTVTMTAVGNSIVDLRTKITAGHSVGLSTRLPGTLYGASGVAGQGQGRDGEAGEMAYATDENTLFIHDGTAFRPAITNAGWTSYTPSLSQGASVTKTIENSKYSRYGSLVVGNVSVALSSAGTAASVIASSVPVAAAMTATNPVIGNYTFYDLSATTYYCGAVVLTSGTTVNFIVDGATGKLGSSGFSGAVASGDILSFNFSYEASI